MWSSARSVFLMALVAATATAELSFVASLQQKGREVDASVLSFVPTTPLTHRKHTPHAQATPSRHGRGASVRDTISYSSNWCGASQHVSQADGIGSVFGYFTAPDGTLRPGVPPPQFVSAWVGIDGAECNTALLQAGVTTIVNSNGGQSISAWWEWYPDNSYTIDGLKVEPGDWMWINITTTSESSAILEVTNPQQEYTMTLDISNGPKLCRVDAEWIVEDFYDANGQVAFANFSDLWFVQSGAQSIGGRSIGLDGAAMVHIQADDGTILCSAEPYDNASFVISSHS
ncbi:uncharacterized protein THITE_2122241 [Thermothielavioides terrestris NRRL 8126]|uniref:Uncharacterized protein n=1 Tax=Thermothielavioides terrestris (strain ATCC 38088 / NRRL 8126) TaxID=578455 RepID=G2RCH8_THETT|nr:uncharacterized protein THITE_2122241 [Thermothielavioides terrestris NRRL 8126]AEO70613.1 hypothetical protein THITE_2122241 [Thermothielavioides terrestris NRRL 8126]